MALFLAFKEVWRNKGRFFLFSLVIALITTLVLFVAALAEGLAQANKQYISHLDAQILVFQKNVDLSAAASRLARTSLNDVLRVPGVADAGPIGFGTGTIIFEDRPNLNVSLIGVSHNRPGDPDIIAGRDFASDRGSEILMDQNVANRAGVHLGDTLRVKTIQGTKEEFYNLTVVGMTPPNQYLFAPTLFLPYQKWDQVRPQGSQPSSLVELTSNVIAVRLNDPTDIKNMQERIKAQVDNVDTADMQKAIEAIPGYTAQQSTLNTQQVFVLLIGILVIGGFFQIQILQKVPQIGVLKAIGASNLTVAAAVVMQIILVTFFGVLLGGMATLGLAAGMPSSVPIQFSGSSVTLAVAALLAIGPIGGLVSVRLAISVEPLLALGLSS